MCHGQIATRGDWCCRPRQEHPALIPAATDFTRSKRWCLRFPLRYVVVMLGLLGCMVDYLVRFGLSVAIVAMVNTTAHHPAGHLALPAAGGGGGGTNNGTSSEGACPAARNASEDDDDFVGGGDFSWTVKEQGIILGTFFWGYFITKTTGGRISELLGARETMAVSLGASGVLSILCPYAAQIHPMALASLRFIMGLVQGPSFPALYSVIASWAPPDEIATMVTIAYSGMNAGSLLAMGSSGWVVDHLGWQWVFWGGGIIALAWTPLWLLFVRNSPVNHPFISSEEEELLAVNYSVKPRRHVPWGRLIRCWRFYPSILAEFASSWITNLTTTEGPTFLKTQIGMSMSEVGLVLTAGQTCSWCGAFVYGRMTDLFIRNGYFSKTNMRRIMHAIGMVMVVLGLLGIVWAGCHKWTVSFLMLVITTGTATTLCSFTLSPMDLAPNYAGTLSGLLGIGNISGFVAPIITAQIITQTGGWAATQLLGAGLYLVVGVVYILSVTTSVQEWNFYEDLPNTSDDQLV